MAVMVLCFLKIIAMCLVPLVGWYRRVIGCAVL